MKVKELIAKYPNYDVVMQGYPDSIPYTQLPSELNGLTGKKFMAVAEELEVKGYEAIAKPFTSLDITHLFMGGKKRPNKTYDGQLYIYLKGGSK